MGNSKLINEIRLADMRIPFIEDQGFYVVRKGESYKIPMSETGQSQYTGESGGIHCSFRLDQCKDYVRIDTKIHVDVEEMPEIIGWRTGIDTYMTEYPQWNDKFFPTMLRCEKTHFWGYFMSPTGKCFALLSPEPISSFRYDYYQKSNGLSGNKIYTVLLEIFNGGKLPYRHPRMQLKKGDCLEHTFYIVPLKKPEDIWEQAWEVCGIPLIKLEKTVFKPEEKLTFELNAKVHTKLTMFSPDGQSVDTEQLLKDTGVYRLIAECDNGRISEACISVLKPYEWYLKQARKEALKKPQKATTHAESWYGYYSAFLAAKHYPDEKTDELLDKSFWETAPYMFDLEKKQPILSPYRVQNLSTMVGVLVDHYEADKEYRKESLYLASAFGDRIMETQKEDGAYYRKGENHYTCVIYIAKSMLELAKAEKELLPEKSQEHYESAGRAVENLVELLERIGTEGEHTLEDGMLSCSALQLGMYALTLPVEKRQRYIDAAEYMLKVHECLEQNIIPDSRMRGGTLRFWEAQYDVLIKGGMFSSPHGWTAWYAYALYYLYLLTGKSQYLIKLRNTLGSCLQLMSFEGNLRWAFVPNPQITVDMFVPDKTKPVKDGYQHLEADTEAFEGKHETQIIGEQYVEMISGWYRIRENLYAGGYLQCPLVYADGYRTGDNQGGACDNDVHEIFKCLEETLLKKAFVYEEEDGSFTGVECKVTVDQDVLVVDSYEDITALHINIHTTKDIVLNGRLVQKNMSGIGFLEADI